MVGKVWVRMQCCTNVRRLAFDVFIYLGNYVGG